MPEPLAPAPGPHTLNPAATTDFLARLRPTASQNRRRTLGWVVLALPLIDMLFTSLGLCPSVSADVVLLGLPAAAVEAPLTFWQPGHAEWAEVLAVGVQLTLLLAGWWLLNGSDRSLWQAPLLARETARGWVIALRAAVLAFVINLALEVAAFRAPLSYPWAGRAVMGMSAVVVLAHLTVRVRRLTLRQPGLHGSLVGAVIAAVGVQAVAALATQLFDLGGVFPTTFNELKVLQLVSGFVAAGFFIVYAYFAALTPLPKAPPAVARTAPVADEVEPDTATDPERSGEEFRDTAYWVELVPDGRPVATVSPPPGGGTPPVIGKVAYSAKGHFIPYAERGSWLVRCPWDRLRLALEPHQLIDLNALGRVHYGRMQVGRESEWLDGGLSWALTLPAELLPDRLPVVAWEQVCQALAAANFGDKIAHAIDTKFARFLSLFDTPDGLPLGRHPELAVARVREQLDLNRGAAFSQPVGGSLIERCTALARLEFEREEIVRWLSAADGATHGALRMAAGMNESFVTDSLESALTSTRGVAEPSFAVRQLLGRFVIDVVPAIGAGRPGLTPAGVRALQDLRQPLRDNLRQLAAAHDEYRGLLQKQLRAERNDAVALRDCRIALVELAAKGVFHKHNAAAVLAQLGLGEVSEMLTGMAAAATRDTDAGRD